MRRVAPPGTAGDLALPIVSPPRRVGPNHPPLMVEGASTPPAALELRRGAYARGEHVLGGKIVLAPPPARESPPSAPGT